MKKNILVLALAMILGGELFAQGQVYYGKNRGRSKNEENIGLRMGLNMSTLKYAGNSLANDIALGNALITKNNGLCLSALYERTFEDKIIYGIELSMISRGVASLDYTTTGIVVYSASMNYQQIPVKYVYSANYFDVRIPVAYKFNIDDKFQPYVYFAPDFGFNYGGSISIKYDRLGEDGTSRYLITEKTVAMGSSNNSKLYIGALIGAGFRSQIKLNKYKMFWLKLDGGYNMGLNNTFSKQELTASVPDAAGVQIYQNNATRKHSGIEVALTVSVPLHQPKKPATNQRAAQEQKQKNSNIKPTAVVKQVVVEKDCYSLDEMVNFINAGGDIANKKICAFGEDINFATNESALQSSSYPYLEKVVTMMENFPNMIIQINGHTDNVGAADVNQKLSHNRAKALFNYLVQSGINPERLSYKGYGSTQAIDSNDTEDGRARNRRVEIEIVSM